MERFAQNISRIVLNPRGSEESLQSSFILKQIYETSLEKTRLNITEAGFSIAYKDKLIKQYASKHNIDISDMDAVEKVMFYPETADERLFSEILLGKLNLEKLVASKHLDELRTKDEFKFFISMAARDLVNNTGEASAKITQEERVVALLDVITTHRNMGIVEIY